MTEHLLRQLIAGIGTGQRIYPAPWSGASPRGGADRPRRAGDLCLLGARVGTF